eukprot:9202588-Lingulodinium_polyedra.AAC.1
MSARWLMMVRAGCCDRASNSLLLFSHPFAFVLLRPSVSVACVVVVGFVVVAVGWRSVVVVT